MPLSKKSIFVALKWLLLFLFVGGLALAMLDEALRAFRARQNKEGTMVNGFALYEKALHSPPNAKTWSLSKKEPGWEFVEFYRPEEKSLLQLPPEFTFEVVSLVRYECGPYRMLYPAGQGWGLF